MLRVFGCDAYALTPNDNRTKLDPKVKKCIFLYFQREVKKFSMWDVNACKFIVNSYVSFNESKLLNAEKKVQNLFFEKYNTPYPLHN